MKTRAVVIAGGTGQRMGLEVPKQFAYVFGKPVIVYTLESFEKHADVDEVTVVCVDGWQRALESYLKKYHLDKVTNVVLGGAKGQESIRNGVFSLEGVADPDDIIIVHDGIRPLVDPAVLADVIRVAMINGNAVTAQPYNEQIFLASEDGLSTTQFIPRETLRRVATPQAYRFDILLAAYKEAFEKGIGIDGSHYTNTMMVELGHRLYFAAGSDKNIKLTTPDDLELFKGYLRSDIQL